MPTAINNTAINLFANEHEAYTPPRYDPAAGKVALDGLAPALDALTEDEIISVKVDVGTATLAALGVVGFVSVPEIRARFAELPARAFEMSHLDELEPACFAMFYSLAEARAAGALEDRARLPAALVAEASEVEERMQLVCEYHLEDDPGIRPELERLRPGSGYQDLAGDLLGYARIYALREEVVKGDPKHYRADDAARATELAGTMLQKLAAAMTPTARAAYDRYVRVWTLLNRHYDQVREAGLWLFRNEPRVEERFPSLFAAARPNVGRPRKVAPKEKVKEGQAGDVAVEASPA